MLLLCLLTIAVYSQFDVTVTITDLTTTGYHIHYGLSGFTDPTVYHAVYPTSQTGIGTFDVIQGTSGTALCSHEYVAGNGQGSGSSTPDQDVTCATNLEMGVSYTLYMVLDLNSDGVTVQLLPTTSTLEIPLATQIAVSLKEITTSGLTLEYTITNYQAGGKMYYALALGDATLTANEIMTGTGATLSGANNCFGNVEQIDDLQHAIDVTCSLIAGQSYSVFVVADADGLGNGLSSETSGSFTVAGTAASAITFITSATTTTLTFNYIITNPNIGGFYYWAVAPSAITLDISEVANPALNGNIVCFGSEVQVDDLQHTVTDSCSLLSGGSYILYTVTDSDGNGSGLIAQQSVQFNEGPIADNPSIIGQSEAGFDITYNIFNPSVGGQAYFVVSDQQYTITDAEQLLVCGQPDMCCKTFAQASTVDGLVDCPLAYDTQYYLYIMTDSDGAGSDLDFQQVELDMLVSQTVSVNLDGSTVSSTGLQWGYQVVNPSVGGVIYWIITPSTSSGLTAMDIVNQNDMVTGGSPHGACGNDQEHVVDSSFYLVVVSGCPLEEGTDYLLWVADDRDAELTGLKLDTNPPITISVPAATPATVPSVTASVVANQVPYGGLSWTYQVTDPNSSAKLYWYITSAADGSFSAADVIANSVDASLCSDYIENLDSSLTTVQNTCPLLPGDYNLWVAWDSDGNGADADATSSPFTINGPALSATIMPGAATDGFIWKYSINNPVSGGYVYWFVQPQSAGSVDGEGIRQQSFDDTLCTSGYTSSQSGLEITVPVECDMAFDDYNLFVAWDLDGEGSWVQTTTLPFSIKNPVLSGSIDQSSVSTNGFSWNYQITDHVPSGNVYWFVGPDDGSTVDAETVRTNSFDNSQCTSGLIDSQDAMQHLESNSCTYDYGDYFLYVAWDTDGQGSNLQMTQIKFSVVEVVLPSLEASIIDSSVSQTSFDWTYTLSNFSPTGSVYWCFYSESEYSLLTAEEVKNLAIDGANGGVMGQIDNLQHTISTTNNDLASYSILLPGTYYLWVVIDSDGQGSNLQMQKLPLIIPEPNMTVAIDQTSVATTGFNWDYTMEFPTYTGDIYWYVNEYEADQSFTGSQIKTFSVDNNLCSGSMDQEDTLTHTVVATCPLTVGASYSLWCAFDWDGSGNPISLSTDPLNLIEYRVQVADDSADSGNGMADVMYALILQNMRHDDDLTRITFLPSETATVGLCATKAEANLYCGSFFQWSGYNKMCYCLPVGEHLELEAECGVFVYKIYGKESIHLGEEEELEGNWGFGNEFEWEAELGLLDGAEMEEEFECEWEMEIEMIDWEEMEHQWEMHQNDPNFNQFEMDEEEIYGAELMPPGHVTVMFNDADTTSTSISFSYSLSHGYLNMKLYWVITTAVHMNLPDIRMAKGSACATCSGSITLTDFNTHSETVDFPAFDDGHYGLWLVGEGKYDNSGVESTAELIPVSSYGFYWNVGPQTIDYSVLFTNMICDDDGESVVIGFTENSDDCSYVAVADQLCGDMFFWNKFSNACFCKPKLSISCDLEEAFGNNVYQIDSVNGQMETHLDNEWTTPEERGENTNPLSKPAEIGKQGIDETTLQWILVATIPISLLAFVLIAHRCGNYQKYQPSQPYRIDLDDLETTTDYHLVGEV